MAITFDGTMTPFEVDVWLSEQITSIKTQLGTGDFTGALQAISTLQSDLTTLQGEVDGIETDITTINSTLTTIAGQITTLQNEMNAVEGDITTIQGNITTLQGSIQSNLDEINALALTVDGHGTRLTAVETYADDAYNLAENANQNATAHSARTDNPHGVTKSQVGLGSVLNYGVASQAEAEAGVSSSKYMTPERTKQAIQKQQGLLVPVVTNLDVTQPFTTPNIPETISVTLENGKAYLFDLKVWNDDMGQYIYFKEMVISTNNTWTMTGSFWDTANDLPLFIKLSYASGQMTLTASPFMFATYALDDYLLNIYEV